MADACAGPCNAAWRNTPEDQRGEPVCGDPVWCPPCTARIRTALAELDDLAALLQATADGHREAPSSPVRGSRHAPTPSAAADTLDELTSILQAWEDTYRELKNWPSSPRRGYLASQTTASIAWLGAHLSGLLEAPFAAEFGTEIRQWHRQLSDATKAGTGKRRKLLPCPRCDLKTLVCREGDDYIRCDNPACNRMLSLTEYDEYAAAAVRSQRAS